MPSHILYMFMYVYAHVYIYIYIYIYAYADDPNHLMFRPHMAVGLLMMVVKPHEIVGLTIGNKTRNHVDAKQARPAELATRAGAFRFLRDLHASSI